MINFNLEILRKYIIFVLEKIKVYGKRETRREAGYHTKSVF